jgi:hydrogenase expression/formation protein HypD
VKYLNEFRDPDVARALANRIKQKAEGVGQIKLMEVCGSHTMAIARYGIRQMLPENVKLISGPGCPVCVTSNDYLDTAIAMGRLDNVILCTFGDMLRVPGSSSSLEKERASGCDIRIVYSTLDALEIARKNQDKKVIFLGVGFETTAPTIAASIIGANKENIQNYFVLCAHKTMPNPMEAIVSGGRVNLNGFICPAHVSTIIGAHPYQFLVDKYGKACVIAGFEPLDVLEAVDMLVAQVVNEKPSVEIQYSRVTTENGNPAALSLMDEVFEECDANWRGIGVIPGSGLKIREKYIRFAADDKFDVDVEPTKEAPGCICGEVMQGVADPPDCALFGTACTPEYPVGACMVSSEGSCAAWYKYER